MTSKHTGNQPLPKQKLAGSIERLTYQNEENGYTVAKLIPKGKAHEVTITGSLASIQVGEYVSLAGFWVTHPKFGRQFEVHSYQVELPATIEGMRKYLGSGLVKGIGPVMAGSIVDQFGLDTLEVIETQPHRLKEVPGIGETRSYRITQAWEEQKHIKDIMLFLQSHAISSQLAVKIYKQYGDDSLEIVQNDPYRLARDIFGVGFKTADKIARSIGLAADAPQRIQAGLLYTLGSLSDDGHCYADHNQLTDEAVKILEIQPQLCQSQITELINKEELVCEDDCIFLPPFYYAEMGSAAKIMRLLKSHTDHLQGFRSIDWQKAFEKHDENRSIRLTDQQKNAIQMALCEKVSILTGGPGTGKSTITHSLINILESQNGSVLLATPTGRAAKRLSEATGKEAKTIHRLLEFSPMQSNPFKRNEENPLKADMIIIDEFSMVDILLMNRLLSAIDIGSHLLLVGDVDQLPSVGAGNVLKDMIISNCIPVTRLDTIFRQANDSYIITNAHNINRGKMPQFSKEAVDFFLFTAEDGETASNWVLDLVTERIPAKFGFDPNKDIQVLSPMHRGDAGVTNLNQRLQAALNPARSGFPELQHGSRSIRCGDRVMQIRNDYERVVFNGDMGHIEQIDSEEHLVRVNFDEHIITYEYSQLDELVHAYAISIHKSQGSEYPVVIIPLLTQHYMMLQRNLLYTAVTRARKLVVITGSKKAIAMAVRNNHIAQRNTKLAERLMRSSV